MANYQYDESGVLASYFALTFLTLILIPLTFSLFPSTTRANSKVDRCDCTECQKKDARLRKANARSIFKPRLGVKFLTTTLGWGLFAVLMYKVATTVTENTVYDPFAILGLRTGTSEKDIKRHFKRLSLKFHPDKVKLQENQTMEEVEAHFVNLTKAYKALTDEEVRMNLEKYGHPDGKQEFSMGLALPSWVVATQNNIWVLGAYGLLFAGLLPVLVGRWWFGSRKYTKDGVLSATAQLFFKNMREEITIEEIIFLLARGWGIENETTRPASDDAVKKLEADIKAVLDHYGKTAETSAQGYPVATRRALALLYAHLLRVPVQDSALADELDKLLLATQTFLGSMLSMTLAHSWLTPTMHVMHLHANLAQATFPGTDPLLVYPAVQKEELKLVEGGVAGYLKALDQKQDPRAEVVRHVANKWGKLDVVDADFKVLGESGVAPGSIVNLVFKMRIAPPTVPLPEHREPTVEQRKEEVKREEAELETFLNSKEDAAPLAPGLTTAGHAHAPYWPANRKPSWWVMIGDQKLNKVIVPPVKVSDVPYANASKAPHDSRTYKLQFQAPPQEGVYTFQLIFVSDTFVAEDVAKFLPLKIEEPAEGSDNEDDISEPDEDTLAGQMAMMRGEKVKRSGVYDDDESSTDDDLSSGDGSSDSDSDSD